MTKTLLGEGAPKGMALVQKAVGSFTSEDIKKFQEHPEMLLQKLQEYAQKEKNIGLKNENLESFGLSPNMIAALSRRRFHTSVIKSTYV